MNPVKVSLAGGDGLGWALDDDLALTRQALGGRILETSVDACEVVHSVWWEGLLAFKTAQLAGKRILCHVPGEPRRYFALPAHRHLMNQMGCWITRSHQATRQMRAVGGTATYIPYAINTDVFRPLNLRATEADSYLRRWSIPAGRYLIGNFHRDSEGSDLTRPKLVKGPDLFVEMMAAVHRTGAPIHVVLAGPRRHWIRHQLERAHVPYTFVGTLRPGDDLDVNILARSTLNELYNLLDLYVVSSRSEGGPQSVMEAAAARCPIISTRVGLAEDILDPENVCDDWAAAVRLVTGDISDRRLRRSLDSHLQRVLSAHSLAAVTPLFRELYSGLDRVSPYRPRADEHPVRRKPRLLTRIAKRLGVSVRDPMSVPLTVGVWHKFFRPPYGGGNQFMLALTKGLRARGIRIVENTISDAIDVYLLNSIHFDISAFERASTRRPLKVVQRIDGPISLARGADRERDEECFRVNQRFASATILQSAWTHERIVEMGYKPVNPVQITNAVDPDIFGPGEFTMAESGKVRLISTSWSDNPRKGGTIYKWLDQNLDWGRFEYSFVGRSSEQFNRIRLMGPVPSEDLADQLRQNDIYVFASQFEACSNALLEALNCGLPALYFDSASNPEVVGYGGLPFKGTEDILGQLDTLCENRAMFRRLIQVPSLEQVTDRYIEVLRDVADVGRNRET